MTGFLFRFRESNCFFAFPCYVIHLFRTFGKNRAYAHAHGAMSINKKVTKYLPLMLAALLWAVLAFHEASYLRKIEDLSLFLFDRLFFIESLRIPGGLLGLAGSFLTQFLHLPWLGSLIWVLLLYSSAALTSKAFNIPERFRFISFIPAILLIISNTSLGYGIFIMRAQDHFFSPTLGYMLSLVPVIAVTKRPAFIKPLVTVVLWAAVMYPFAGIWALTGSLAAGICVLASPEPGRGRRIAVMAASAASFIIIPILYYNLYTSIRLTDAWTAGLPTISDDVWTGAVRAPYYLIMAFSLIIPVAVPQLTKTDSVHKDGLLWHAVPSAVFVLFVWIFWFNDSNFRTELSMSLAVDNAEWQQTVDLFTDASQKHARSDARAYKSRTAKIAKASDNDQISDIVERYRDRFFEPTRTMVMYRDLALLKMNRALELSFTMKDGGRQQKSRTQITMAYQSGKQFYFNYGLENMCYRWCMEDIIEHGWSYSTHKYMAMYAIVTGEKELALKHIGKLSKTLFYRKWAESQKELLSDKSLLAQAEPYKGVMPMLCFEDHMSNDMGKPELFIINHFAGQQPENATAEYDRAALLFAMRSQDIPKFWERLYHYINSNSIKKLPVSVQEAALLYSSLEKDGMELPYDKSVTDGYNNFNKYVNSHPIRSMEESMYPYSQKFGRTFQFYYYFIRNLKTY